MVQAFFAVVYDLWCFVTGIDVVSQKMTTAGESDSVMVQIDSLLGTDAQTLSNVTIVESVRPQIPVAEVSLHEPTIMYVRVLHTNMHRVPRSDFDVVIMSLPYGAAVTAVSYDGAYAKVFKAEVEGWIIKDHLEPAKEVVWPQLQNGTLYASDHSETIKLRKCIGDEFSAGSINLPLQAVEYVMLRLALDNRYVLWSLTRPRVAGSWQWLLRGGRGVHISVNPVTDSVIEWLAEDGFGRLGYIEAVHPDRSIVVSLVGLRNAGVYEVVTWEESVWRELRPVFIEVT